MTSSVFSTADAAVVVAVISLIAGWVTVVGARTRKEIRQINRAVNHQGDNQPTLIQRVIHLEQNQAIHAAWTADVLMSLCAQIGASLPPRPKVNPLKDNDDE